MQAVQVTKLAANTGTRCGRPPGLQMRDVSRLVSFDITSMGGQPADMASWPLFDEPHAAYRVLLDWFVGLF